MRRALALVVGLVATSATGAGESVLAFHKADVGKLPTGWHSAKTGTAHGSKWSVVADDTTPSKSGVALAQTATGPDELFNLCVADTTSFGRNIKIDVAFKVVAGRLDQGGGPVWLYKDANNYYVARMNPLESNLRVYRVVNGKRTLLATQPQVSAAADKWHTLEVKHVDDKITVTFDGGAARIVATDATFTHPGKIGLWTKADAQTRFDRVTVTEVAK